MTYSRLTCCLPALLAVTLARAQTEPASREKEPSDQARQTQEDVAVFRLLLNRSLARASGLAEGKVHGTSGHAHALPQAEGVVLKGQGVVYTAAVPLTWHRPVEKGGKSKEPTSWEKAQSELRGEKVAEPKTGERRERPLSETLVQLLMENGRHFRTLAPEQRITIAVSFRSSLECTKCHQAQANTTQAYLSGLTTSYLYSGQYGGLHIQPGTGAMGYPPGPMVPAATASLPLGGGVPTQPRETEGSSEVLLGELNYRQGKYTEAGEAYMRALKKLQDEKTPPDLKRMLQIVEIANRLAQVKVALGDQDGAAQLLKVARKFADEAEKVATKKKPDTSSAIPLPPQLVISATKQQLEAVAANKMTLEEFMKLAQIEYRTFEEKKEKEKEKE